MAWPERDWKRGIWESSYRSRERYYGFSLQSIFHNYYDDTYYLQLNNTLMLRCYENDDDL